MYTFLNFKNNMKYLHLTDDFTPFSKTFSDIILYSSFTFNGGEPHLKISLPDKRSRIMITSRINNTEDLFKIQLAADVLTNSGICKELYLFVPYFPGARQDRRTSNEEPLTVKVYDDIINSIGFEEVIIFDPHSDVTPALLNNCTVIDNIELVSTIINNYLGYDRDDYYLVSPDGGAIKKTNKIAVVLNSNVVYGSKNRNISTGELTNIKIDCDDLKGKPCIIVDDICDGGGTFIGLAEELKKKNSGELFLVVSHGIFSKGFKELSKYFTEIYTTDSIRTEFNWEQQEREKTNLVTIIPLNSIIC